MILYDLFLKHPIISTDSRNCPEGSLFFALKGENFNANAFAAKALETGAAYAVIDESEYAVDSRYIVVENVLENLQELARYHRKNLGTIIIGITGTNGKTTTKELIASVLKEKFNILYTEGNLNNHIGVPLTLLKLKPEHQLAIIEMGANHLGEIDFLTKIALPDYGIITNVGKAHLEGFGSLEGVMKTKAELYDFIVKAGKVAFINHDNLLLLQMADNSGLTEDKRIYFAENDHQGQIIVAGSISELDPFINLEFKLPDGKSYSLKSKLIGSYNRENILSAIAIGHYFEMNVKDIIRGLESYEPKNNRSQMTITVNNKLIVDAYNANPTSMQAAIRNFSAIRSGHKMLILGDMLELGQTSEYEHKQIILLLKEFGFEKVLLVGSIFSSIENPFINFRNQEEASVFLQNNIFKNQLILIKGSRGIKLEKLIEYL